MLGVLKLPISSYQTKDGLLTVGRTLFCHVFPVYIYRADTHPGSPAYQQVFVAFRKTALRTPALPQRSHSHWVTQTGADAEVTSLTSDYRGIF